MEQRPIGGLGVFLAIRGVDSFLYERVNDRNRSTFIVHRGKPAEHGR
jgi:anti-sigma regulatory factor (Ser/Thr protein kinase)